MNGFDPVLLLMWGLILLAFREWGYWSYATRTER